MEIYAGGPLLLLPAVLDLRPLIREVDLVSLPVGAGIALQGLIAQDPVRAHPLC